MENFIWIDEYKTYSVYVHYQEDMLRATLFYCSHEIGVSSWMAYGNDQQRQKTLQKAIKGAMQNAIKDLDRQKEKIIQLLTERE